MPVRQELSEPGVSVSRRLTRRLVGRWGTLLPLRICQRSTYCTHALIKRLDCSFALHNSSDRGHRTQQQDEHPEHSQDAEGHIRAALPLLVGEVLQAERLELGAEGRALEGDVVDEQPVDLERLAPLGSISTRSRRTPVCVLNPPFRAGA